MYDLTNHFRPATAQPFMNTTYYSEIPPGAALKSYIRCFWGTSRPIGAVPPSAVKSLVIPDCCMDIIFRVDHTQDRVAAFFCGLDENGWEGASTAGSGGLSATFGIRFYLWAAGLFASDTLSGSAGRGIEAEALFPELVREMREYLRRGLSLERNAEFAEGLLLKSMLRQPEENLMNALERIISCRGRLSAAELSAYTGCTPKRLQRLFCDRIGASAKPVMSVIRYQLMWQEMLSGGSFSVLDAVERYGYYDQAHLLHDFKRRHLMTPTAALELAMRV